MKWLGAATAVGIIALTGCGGSKHAAAPTSYAFDSAYEVKEAEARLNERILNKEMAAERPGGRGGEDRLKTTRCVVSPPPPAARRMHCTVVTLAKEIRSRISVTHFFRRTATIELNPQTGALTIHISRPSVSRAVVTP